MLKRQNLDALNGQCLTHFDLKYQNLGALNGQCLTHFDLEVLLQGVLEALEALVEVVCRRSLACTLPPSLSC